MFIIVVCMPLSTNSITSFILGLFLLTNFSLLWVFIMLLHVFRNFLFVLCFLLLHVGLFSGKHLNLKLSIFDAFKAILKLFWR